MNYKEGMAVAVFLALLAIGFSMYWKSDMAQKDSITPQKETQLSSPNTAKTSMEMTTSQTTPRSEVTLQTSEGAIIIALNSGQTPKTVENFVTLAKKGFYDGTVFHRVISGFMIQGGDPKGDGTGGPGYTFVDEPFTGEYVRGTVAMANAGPDTNGSQFFIMHADYPLPKNYTIFGSVIQGMDTVDKIAGAPVTPNQFTGEPSKPVNPVTIIGATVTEK